MRLAGLKWDILVTFYSKRFLYKVHPLLSQLRIKFDFLRYYDIALLALSFNNTIASTYNWMPKKIERRSIFHIGPKRKGSAKKEKSHERPRNVLSA